MALCVGNNSTVSNAINGLSSGVDGDRGPIGAVLGQEGLGSAFTGLGYGVEGGAGPCMSPGLGSGGAFSGLGKFFRGVGGSSSGAGPMGPRSVASLLDITV